MKLRLMIGGANLRPSTVKLPWHGWSSIGRVQLSGTSGTPPPRFRTAPETGRGSSLSLGEPRPDTAHGGLRSQPDISMRSLRAGGEFLIQIEDGLDVLAVWFRPMLG